MIEFLFETSSAVPLEVTTSLTTYGVALNVNVIASAAASTLPNVLVCAGAAYVKSIGVPSAFVPNLIVLEKSELLTTIQKTRQELTETIDQMKKMKSNAENDLREQETSLKSSIQLLEKEMQEMVQQWSRSACWINNNEWKRYIYS